MSPQPSAQKSHWLSFKPICLPSELIWSAQPRKKQPVKHKSRELCAGFARGKRKEERKTSPLGSIQSFGQLSRILWGKSGRLELCFSGWCLSEFRVVSCLTLGGSITKQKNHFLARAASHFLLPGPHCILPHLLSYRCLERSAPAPSSVPCDFLTSILLRKVGKFLSSSFWMPCALWAFLCP